MTATLTKSIIVPQYENGLINLYNPDPVTGAPTVDAAYTVDVTAILNALFPGQGRIAAPNAVTVHGNDLFFTNSSSNSQAVIELPNYLNNPAAAIANAFVVTADGNDYTGLAFDASGHLYTAEGSYGDNQIVRYTLPATTPAAAAAAGDNYTAKAVIGNAGLTSYFGDVTFDSSGNLWVADYQNNRVVVFDAANLGGTDTWHAITNVAGSLAVANTTAGLTGTTAHLFAEPEGVAFDGAGALWIGNNNDGGAGVTNTLTSLVKITKSLQDLILASPANTNLSAADILANNNVFIYQVPNNADNSRPQFGGVQIDTTAGVLYANEEIGGDARAYTLATIAATPLDPSASLLAVTTTNPGNGGLALVCFLAGTGIVTTRGEVAVENLVAGDTVVTRFGPLRPVKWIGRQSFDSRFLGQAKAPVCFRAGSLAPNVPSRDLYVSPDHSMVIDDRLVVAKLLVNGVTITQQATTGTVEYFHLDFGVHDCVIANGAWSESYAEQENRGAFHNAAEFAGLFPDHQGSFAEFCLPLIHSAGPELAPVLAKLAERFPAGSVSDGRVRPVQAAAATKATAPGMDGARLDEIYAHGSYRHVDLLIYRLAAAGTQWPRVKLKLCHLDGRNYLEFRQMAGWPSMFAAWPGTQRDRFGELLRIGADDGDVVLPLPQPRDRLLLQGIGTLLPAAVETALAGAGHDAETIGFWRDQARTVASYLLAGNVTTRVA